MKYSDQSQDLRDRIVVLDFGSQTSQLILRRIREQGVYCELVPGTTPWSKIRSDDLRGLVLSGSPASVYDADAPKPDKAIFEQDIPILGICYGLHLMAQYAGGEVQGSPIREYGRATLTVDRPSLLLQGLPNEFTVWMSHGDHVSKLPYGYNVLGTTTNCAYAAVGYQNRFGLQFHPEVAHTEHGKQILANFLFNVCKCKATWSPGSFIDRTIEEIRSQVDGQRVICALSGGVDSTVTATLVHKAIGDQLECIFVNNGLLRKREAERVLGVMSRLNIKVRYVDASERFLAALKGVVDPEEKRKIVGHVFVEVFTEEASKLGDIGFLAQGTLYPDVIESTSSDTFGAARIKSHHNVGGLPEKLPFKLLEPLRHLFKDEVREVGLKLGLPSDIVFRQPFPGPGLAVRCLGEITKEKLDILREADWVVIDEIKKAGLYHKVWQAFAVLTSDSSVGVMGDARTYGNVIAVRVVTSDDAMTADWARLPYDVLARISSRIVNEVRGVTRVVYDITSKPPGTIEWE
jgi:GMP synthase (glutamine-hydrolysing)